MRQNFSSGGPWEARVGYARAVRVGERVVVAGTTATTPEGVVLHPGDAYGQARAIFEAVETALAQAGFSRENIIGTRMFVVNFEDQEAVGRAHKEFFGEINPVATMVGVAWLAHPPGACPAKAERRKRRESRRPRYFRGGRSGRGAGRRRAGAATSAR